MRWPFENSQYKGENCSIGENNNKLAAKKKKTREIFGSNFRNFFWQI